MIAYLDTRIRIKMHVEITWNCLVSTVKQMFVFSLKILRHAIVSYGLQ